MTLVIEDSDVAAALPMADCIEAMEVAYSDYAARGAINIPRIRYRSETSDPQTMFGSNIHIGTTPTYDTAAIRVGGSAQTRDPADRGAQRPKPGDSNWGFICLIYMRTGELLAIIQEFLLSGIRVGATSGLAAKHLAGAEASTVAMFGSGKLARTNLEALVQVRPVRRVNVFSPTREHRERYAKEMSAQLEIDVVPFDAPRDAMLGAEIVCCATNAGYISGEPVVYGHWLEPGQLVISLQNSDRNFTKSEVDEATMVRSKIIVINDRESVESNEQRELLDPIERGTVTWDKIFTLGDIVTGHAGAKTQPEDIIYYKNNTGMGIQMAAAGAKIYRRARELGLGHEIPTEWFGSDLTAWYERGFFPSA